MSLIGVFHRYTYIFHGYSGISVVFRYFGDSCDPRNTTIWANSADDKKKKKKKKNRYLPFFYYQENRFDIHEKERICMKCKSCLKNEKNISECRLLKILPRVLGVMVCTNKSRIGLCMAKPTIKLVRRDGSACTL